MNEAIEKQLEARLRYHQAAGIPRGSVAHEYAIECAALRELCAMAVEAIECSQDHEFREEEIALLKLAAEGKELPRAAKEKP